MHLYTVFHQMIILSCVAILLCTLTSGVTSQDSKKYICCTKDNLTLHEPIAKINSCYIFPAKGECDAAVVFIYRNNLYQCIDPEAPWLSKRMARLRKRGVTCKDVK